MMDDEKYRSPLHPGRQGPRAVKLPQEPLPGEGAGYDWRPVAVFLGLLVFIGFTLWLYR